MIGKRNRMGTINEDNNFQASTTQRGGAKHLIQQKEKSCLSEGTLFILTLGFIILIYYLLVVFTYRLLQSTCALFVLVLQGSSDKKNN